MEIQRERCDVSQLSSGDERALLGGEVDFGHAE